MTTKPNAALISLSLALTAVALVSKPAFAVDPVSTVQYHCGTNPSEAFSNNGMVRQATEVFVVSTARRDVSVLNIQMGYGAGKRHASRSISVPAMDRGNDASRFVFEFKRGNANIVLQAFPQKHAGVLNSELTMTEGGRTDSFQLRCRILR